MKYLAVTCVFLAICVIILFNLYTNSRNEINTLKNEKNVLETTIEEMKNAEMASNKTIKRLREAIADNKDDFDWYRHPIPLSVLNELQKQHNSRKTN